MKKDKNIILANRGHGKTLTMKKHLENTSQFNIDDDKKEVRGINGGNPTISMGCKLQHSYKENGYKFFDSEGNDITDQCWEPGKLIFEDFENMPDKSILGRIENTSKEHEISILNKIQMEIYEFQFLLDRAGIEFPEGFYFGKNIKRKDFIKMISETPIASDKDFEELKSSNYLKLFIVGVTVIFDIID